MQLANKDWSQINAAKAVWNNCKVQLCLWHAKKLIKKRLSDNSKPKHNPYNSIEANSKIIELFTKYFHLHPLIPIKHGEFLSSKDIWKLSIKEMYDYCYNNNLKYVWSYMWCNWYKFNL
ncbi:hypothetical protein C1646_773861 [Rhizophagus diaphanus]|nr:hypothetical protein C1646_773861 [Rhizophagus diaphanus] [Rhizophagus sp. MUCL 43196]